MIDKIKAEIERRIQHAKDNPQRYPDATSSIWSLQGILSFIESLEKEQPQGLDEAAEEYASDEMMGGLAERAFKAGAAWMAGQGVTIEDEVCELYDKLYLYYIDDCSSMTPDTSCEMLKELGASKGDEVVVQIRKAK